MLTSTQVRDAFDLAREQDALRDRYGANFFGQSCLLARRLVEAGTRFVQVKWYDGPAFDAWDVHGADLGGMVRMEQHLCPRLDQGLTALLDDLHQRGLLRIDAGRGRRRVRPHAEDQQVRRPRPLAALLLGPAGRRRRAGRRGRRRQRPRRRPPHATGPSAPAEFAATLYRLMGIDTNTDPASGPSSATPCRWRS